MKGEPAANLEIVDPKARAFPPSWRDAAIRALFDASRNGVVCPGCGKLYQGRRELRLLHADHIVAWSRGGQTTWNNLQLLCRPCNLTKQDNSWEGCSCYGARLQATSDAGVDSSSGSRIRSLITLLASRLWRDAGLARSLSEQMSLAPQPADRGGRERTPCFGDVDAVIQPQLG
jgi:HNH endonuclease